MLQKLKTELLPEFFCSFNSGVEHPMPNVAYTSKWAGHEMYDFTIMRERVKGTIIIILKGKSTKIKQYKIQSENGEMPKFLFFTVLLLLLLLFECINVQKHFTF